MSKEKRNKLLSIFCKILIIITCLELLGIAYIRKVIEFMENYGFTEECVVFGWFGVMLIQMTVVVLLAVKYDLKLDNPHTKKYTFKYDNFSDFNKYLDKLLNKNKYNFIKNIQYSEELEIYIYLKKGTLSDRLFLMIKSNEFNKKTFDDIVLKNFYRKNLKKIINIEVNIKELIVVYCLEKYNINFEKQFINNVFILNNYYYTIPAAMVFEKNTLYLPKVIDFRGTYIKKQMIKEIKKIFELKNQHKLR